MKSKSILALALLMGGAGFAQAAETTASADKIYGNITQSHFGISASLSLSSTSIEGAGGFTTFTFNARGQYFLVDRFALGPVLKLTTQDTSSDLSIGPSALYYFWTRERLGLFLSQDVTLRSVSNSGNASSTWRTETQLGLNYFLYPAVAIGPAVDFLHQFGTNWSAFNRINQLTFLGQLSIYL